MIPYLKPKPKNDTIFKGKIKTKNSGDSSTLLRFCNDLDERWSNKKWFPDIRKATPFLFFVYCRMRFLILGRSVGKRKKKRKNKIGKGVWRPGTSA